MSARMNDQTSRVHISRSPDMLVHYISSRTVYAEQLEGSRWVGRYWSASGIIETPDALTKVHRDAPTQAFALNIDGQSLDWGWTVGGVQASPLGAGQQAAVELIHATRPVKVVVRTHTDGSSFLTRWLDITNTGTTPAALANVDVFSGALRNGFALRGGTFEDTPFQVGHFTGNHANNEGRLVWAPLRNAVAMKLFAAGPYATGGYQSPYFIVASHASSEHFVFYLGWSGPWRAEIFCDATLREILHVRLGPDAPAPQRVLAPGETISTPKVHIGCIHGDLDHIVQASHTHIRRSVFLTSPRMPRPLVTHNSYGSCGLDALTEESILRDVELAHELGCEVYMMDAGWYGKGPDSRRSQHYYTRFMGDWVPGEWFPRGLKPMIDAIKNRGMLFGLWLEPEALGLESETYRQHPDWIAKREGRPQGHALERLTLDLTQTQVAQWLESELHRMIREYDVDVIRFDGAPMWHHLGERHHEGFNENTIWRHYETLYGIMERMRDRFPNLLIENCCGGGGRLDLGMLSRSHRTQITDYAGTPGNIKVLNGLSLMLPPEYCLVWPFYPNVRAALANLDFIFRAVLFGDPCFLGLTRRIADQHPGYVAAAKRYIHLYKTFVAPLLPGCRVYHHTPLVRVEPPDLTPHCVWEYVAADGRSAMIGIFKLSDAPVPIRVHPRGLDAGRRYRVTFDNAPATAEVDGFTLMNHGLNIPLSQALTSELVCLNVI